MRAFANLPTVTVALSTQLFANPVSLATNAQCTSNGSSPVRSASNGFTRAL
jgi:hypothetical protein